MLISICPRYILLMPIDQLYFQISNCNVFVYETLAYVFQVLSRKRPPLGHDKVVAYGRWSLTGKIKHISLILD